MLEHTTDLLSCWISRGGKNSKKKWSIMPSCIWWSIWKERNSRCFEKKANLIEKVKWNCLTTFYIWCKEEGIEKAAQILDFIGTLYSISLVFFSCWDPFFGGLQHIPNAEEYNIFSKTILLGYSSGLKLLKFLLKS
ncbi:hypothetical protein MTR67_030037 [Solanum verrucosum]|uniref:Uncharacterized protein n=1 Tax=Solanum verrucosum TaxID=315347 RepID=A0AAF0TXB9_SOLVR|nr:hypothetical protein MTR67_030037 [Solanum verrucosum]